MKNIKKIHREKQQKEDLIKNKKVIAHHYNNQGMLAQ